MQIVIDIDKQIFDKLTEYGEPLSAGNGFHDSILKAVANGIPLPKGHGRLIDANDLIQDIIDDNQLCIFNSESERIIHDEMVNFAIDRITDASTTIDADK